MGTVTSKAEVITTHALDKQGDDIWADFRTVERLNIEMTQTYKHSLGKYSRFFVELENQKFLATTCDTCGMGE